MQYNKTIRQYTMHKGNTILKQKEKKQLKPLGLII